jgi:hypothetical protein
MAEGQRAKEEASGLLGYYRQDYPSIVRAVKTRDTACTVLMHKSRFVKSLAKAGLLEDKEANILEVYSVRPISQLLNMSAQRWLGALVCQGCSSVGPKSSWHCMHWVGRVW